jgi:stress response protein YsnF
MATLPNGTVEDSTLKVVEERLEVHRETEEVGAVRVRIKSSRRSEIIDEPTVRRGLHVERVARNSPAARREAPWYDGDVMVVPVYEEVLVKQLMLKEEVRLAQTTDIDSRPLAVELLQEFPVFERLDEQGRWVEVPAEQLDVRDARR